MSPDEMHAGGRAWLEAEAGTLGRMLACLSDEDVVGRLSLQGRLEEVRSALETFPADAPPHPKNEQEQS